MTTMTSPFDAIRGQCLDAAWVANVSATLGVNPSLRDPKSSRLLYPWLRSALQKARFKINDPRQALPTAFQRSCMDSGDLLSGGGERVFVTGGAQASQGTFQGTITIEYNSWPSHWLTSAVLGVLLQEVGYDVTFLQTPGGLYASQRMSAEGMGQCTPTHINAEIWTAAKLPVLSIYANETTSMSNGYGGQYVVFPCVSKQTNLNEALKGPSSTQGTFERAYSADFWHEYTRSQDLVNYYSPANTDMPRVAVSSVCPNGTMGCQNGCSKSHACSVAEQNNQTCLVVAMMEPVYDPGFLQAAIANNNIPAYFCFSGYGGVQNAVVDAMTRNKSITFYHFEPDFFHLQYEGLLTRIELPRSQPKIVATATGTFGENGYGNPATNSVNVDFPQEHLKLYYANVLNSDAFLVDFINKFQIAQIDINSLLASLVKLNEDNPSSPNAPFIGACDWVKTNYRTWKSWVSPLPLCSPKAHMQYTMTGCNDSSRMITFLWSVPDPTNASLPYQCDGGDSSLPSPLSTSRSCDWLNSNVDQWTPWLRSKPLCDGTFYNYSVAACDASATRAVGFFWLLPQLVNPLLSVECTGGVVLPSNTTVQCDYVPTNSSAYGAMTGLAIVVLLLLVCSTSLVVIFRDRPVIKRAQWPLLVCMICGGICICIYVLLGAGAPSSGLCAARPVTIIFGYTLVFGSLLVKGLRVYWVFKNKSLKKVTVSLWKIAKLLLIMLCVDAVILLAWMVADFPAPTTETTTATEFIGKVDHVSCHSSSFIFSALLIFWKAIITFGGVYVSFLIRDAGSDFQESVWIFASSCVVLLVAL
ncbi:hypothetical protein As57867_014498, partial [Aphanomyces stellatus]